jgi:hypothetical protein
MRRPVPGRHRGWLRIVDILSRFAYFCIKPMKKPRVVVIGKKNYLHWDEHVVAALRELGCAVWHFQSNSRPLGIQVVRGVSKLLLGNRRAKFHGDRQHAGYLYAKIRSLNPDVIFFTNGVLIGIEYFRILRDLPGRPQIVAWDGDGAPGFESTRDYVPYIDHFFETEGHYVRTNPMGFRHTHHLPFAANPRIHNNQNRAREDKLYFCGAWTQKRDEIFSQIHDYPMVLKGWHWNRLSHPGAATEIHSGTVAIDAQAADYNRYRMVFNLHQVENNHFGALNMRTFEAPACGAALLSDDRAELPLMLEPEREVMVYTGIEDLRETLMRARQDTAWVNAIAAAGHRRVLQEHTYRHRMEKVLEVIALH